MKRFFAVCLVGALLLSFSGSASVAVNGRRAALVGEDGSTIVAPGVYSEIIPLNGCERFAARDANGAYLLMDADGNALTKAEYDYFEAGEGAILFEKGNRYGVMNEYAEIVVPCEYSWIVSNGENGFLALRTDVWDDTPDGVYYIDESGRVAPTGVKVISLLSPFTNGLSPALSTEKGRYGYLNAKGEWAIPPQYAFADEFYEGRAMAMLDSGCGLIDENGGWIISPKYDYLFASRVGDGIIAGVNYGLFADVYAADGREELFSHPCSDLGVYVTTGGEHLFVYGEDELIALNREGETVLTVSVDGMAAEGGKNRMIVYEDFWGTNSVYLADETGKAVSGRYQDMDLFWNRLENPVYIVRAFPVDENGDWDAAQIRCGLIDSNGAEVLETRFTEIRSPADGWAVAEDGEGTYLYRLDGTLVWSLSGDEK